MKFSENLRKLIRAKGLKLKAISEETGIPMSTLSEWTAGREPKVSDALIRLCYYFGVTMDELILGRVLPAGEIVVAESYFEVNGQSFSMRVCSRKSED